MMVYCSVSETKEPQLSETVTIYVVFTDGVMENIEVLAPATSALFCLH